MSPDDGDQIIPFPENRKDEYPIDDRPIIIFTIDESLPGPIWEAGQILLEKSKQGYPMSPFHVRAILHNTPREPHLVTFTSTGESEIPSEPGKRHFEQIRCLGIQLNGAVMYYEIERKTTRTEQNKGRVSHDNARLVEECYIAFKNTTERGLVFAKAVLNIDTSNGSIRLDNDFENKEIDQTYHHIVPQESVKILRAIAKEKGITFEEAAEGIIPYKAQARALARNWDHPINFIIATRTSHDWFHKYPEDVQIVADEHLKTKAGRKFLLDDNKFTFHKGLLEQKQPFWDARHDRVMTAMTTIILFMSKGAGDIKYMKQGPSAIHPNSQFYWDIAALHDEIYEEDATSYIEAMRQLILGGIVPPDLAARYLGFDSDAMSEREVDEFMNYMFTGKNEIYRKRIKNKMKELPDNIA